MHSKLTVGNEINNNEYIAVKVSTVSIVGNILLTVFKLISGVISNSGAMISDAIHSASDIMSSIAVIIGVKMAAKESDEDHHYGHERFECVAAIILATILMITGMFIGVEAIEAIKYPTEIKVPGKLALVAAIISIMSKEAMYWYTRHYALKIKSEALMADAWHHRSDALSSVGAFIGIGGAMLGYKCMDAIASLIICLFIVKVSLDIFKEAISKMTDKVCDETTVACIKRISLNGYGVRSISEVKTRVFGNKVYVDMKIKLDGKMTLSESSRVAKDIHKEIEANVPEVKHINILVYPDE